MTIPLPNIPGAQDSPGTPSGVADDNKLDFEKDRYSRDLDAWLEGWKQQVAALAVDTAVMTSREDTEKAVRDGRQDTLTALNASRADADRAAEVALLKSIHDGYIAVTQSSLDRALNRLNVLTAAIASVTTVYTGLLALVFAAKPGEGKPLTGAAVIPALFLGTGLLLATIYAALFRKSRSSQVLLLTGLGGQIDETRLTTFMTWCFQGIWNRTWALHASIVSLAIGIATLPVPFVTLTGKEQVWILILGALTVAATGTVSKLFFSN